MVDFYLAFSLLNKREAFVAFFIFFFYLFALKLFFYNFKNY